MKHLPRKFLCQLYFIEFPGFVHSMVEIRAGFKFNSCLLHLVTII